MGRKRSDDRQIEDRIRAHIRQRMTKRRLGVTAAAKLIEVDQGNLTKILMGERGISAGVAFRVSLRFQIELEHLFHLDPPEEFWRYYVPRPAPDPADASPETARPPRQEVRGAGTGSGTYPATRKVTRER